MLIHGRLSGSRVNGPGLRAVIYFQGCTLGCRDCWNPESHTFAGEERTSAEVGMVVSADQERALEGVTFSGGEPMQQADTLLALMEMLRDRMPRSELWHVLRILGDRIVERSLLVQIRTEAASKTRRFGDVSGRHLDFAVLGRYAVGQPSTLALRTSANQKLALFSERYGERDFEPQEVEIHIDTQGFVQVTGFPTAGIPG